MGIFTKIVVDTRKVKDLEETIARRVGDIAEYRDLTKRLFRAINRPYVLYGYGIDHDKYNFEAYVEELEKEAAKTAERNKIRVYVKEILAEKETHGTEPA